MSQGGHAATSGTNSKQAMSSLMNEVEQEMLKHGKIGISSNDMLPTKRPLLTRPWVPAVCLTALLLIWTPEKYKLAFLQGMQDVHEHVQFKIHSTYWRLSMEPAAYETLMRQVAEGVRKGQRIKSPDCPF